VRARVCVCVRERACGLKAYVHVCAHKVLALCETSKAHLSQAEETRPIIAQMVVLLVTQGELNSVAACPRGEQKGEQAGELARGHVLDNQPESDHEQDGQESRDGASPYLLCLLRRGFPVGLLLAKPDRPCVTAHNERQARHSKQASLNVGGRQVDTLEADEG
jgi:hypothetical protein